MPLMAGSDPATIALVALLLFAVAHDHVNAVGGAAEFCGKGAAHGGAESLSQGAAGNFDAGNFQPIGMTFES